MTSFSSSSEDAVGAFSDPLTFNDGEDSEIKTHSESQGVYRQVVSMITAFFPESRAHDTKPVDPT